MANQKFTPSPQQQTIFDAITNTPSHIIIEALAGTGKTTTILATLDLLPRNLRVAFVAFNKSIATELQQKVPNGVTASTLHSLGFAAVRSQVKVKVDDDKTINLLPPKMDFNVKLKVKKLVSLCKAMVVDGKDFDELDELATKYDIELNGDKDEVFSAIADVLRRSADRPTTIDFDDMVWLPVVWGLKLSKFDIMFVDEAQDLNRVQQQLILASAKRIVLVGDRKQAIYGFRGADVGGMLRMENILRDSPLGVTVLPLTITRRCPQAVTRLAQSLVPTFECAPEVKEGAVISNYNLTPNKGDMVLCRTNAPIIQMAYSLIQENVPVKIQGRDIGAGLAALIKKLVRQDASTVELVKKVQDYHTKEIARISAEGKNVDAKLQSLEDKVQCITFLCEGMDLVSDVLGRIQMLFSDVEKGNNQAFVLLSSIHRAKGLEADAVHILEPNLLPHPMAKLPWQVEQEYNLKYVAITRAKDTLYIRG